MGIHDVRNLVALAGTESTAGSATGATNYESTQPADNGYQIPPEEIRKIVDAPPTPTLMFSPTKKTILFLQRRSLAPLSDIARPELKLGGMRIDPEYNTKSRMSFYTGIHIRKVLSDNNIGEDLVMTGVPEGSRINYCSWSPDGRYFAFSVREPDQGEGPVTLPSLWVADAETGKARQLLGAPEYALNTVLDHFSWIDDTRLVVCTIPQGRGAPPKKPPTPFGPKIQSNEGQAVMQNRTYQDLLKDSHDENLFEYYATSQIVIVSIDGQALPIGPPALYCDVEASPDGHFLLVRYLHRPFSFIVHLARFPKKIEVWRPSGEIVKEVCDLPLAEDIPISFDSARKGRRSVNWRNDKLATLYWVEAQDGGDPKNEVSPRDIVYTEPAEGGFPQVIAETDLRFQGICWMDDDLALLYDGWYKTRKTRTWVITPGNPEKEKHILFDRSTEDVYGDPGSPKRRQSSLGTYVLAQVRNSAGNKCLLLDGRGATPEGNIPFLDLLDIETGEKERIWQSVKEKYYETLALLMAPKGDEVLTLDNFKIVIARESQTEPHQFYFVCWPAKTETRITNFPHPYPQLKDLNKEIIRYARSDGVQLTATLYTPPGFDSAKGKLPLLMWAYPREFKSKDNASQMRGSPFSFAGINSTSPLLWLARGFAILDGPTMPIIGEGDEEPNERYVEQLVASAKAAVDEVVRRGVADPNKIAVGGHSYGAFMTANLLIHASDLFACGIARSGAYNRTLTPFGFQAEERTLWEAQKTYIEMSPYMYANRVKKPLLLIHGDEDNNSGTMTMQSERFFSALKGHGALTRLVLLPLESHGYQGRESVMHCLWEMDRWLQLHCVNATGNASASDNAEANPAVTSSGAVGESANENDPFARPSTRGFAALSL